jgi:DNA-binding SARP family transcriptional activator/TolB-like protein
VSRDRLLALFWPESDATHARNTLSQALHQLRHALGADVIESHGATAVGVRSEQLWCDATEFTGALDRGEVELALDLYRGEFCPTLFTSGAPELEQWLDSERRRLRAQALTASRSVAEQLVVRGEAEHAARAARRALAMQPDDESDVRVLLGLLERCGDLSGALLAYQEYARRLAADLETEPALETQRLVETMRRRREQQAAAATADGESATTAGVGPAPYPARTAPLPRMTWIRRRPGLVTALALAVAGGGVLFGLQWRGRHVVAPPVRTLAVFPFTLRGGAPFVYLRDGMVDLMSAKLDGAEGFHAIDPRSVLSAVAGQDATVGLNAEANARIARRLGAGWYISGDVIEVAGRLQLDGTLVDVNEGSETVATATVSGDTAALFELVDDLAGRMLARLSSGRDTALTRLAAVTTHSLPALKLFLDGERALRVGRDAQAAAAFGEAAMLDTGFALAQYRLALTATWVHVPDAEDPAAWAAIAARHAQRLTPLVRDLLTAYRAYKDLRAEDAERLYRSVTQSHPDNVEAWFMLGETFFHYNPWRGRSPMEAWTPFQRVLALDPSDSHAMIHLARLAAAEGRIADLDSLARRYLERYPDAERALEMRALVAYVHDDLPGRKAVTAAARDADDDVMTSLFQAAALYAQNLDAARDLAGPFSGGLHAAAFRQLRQRYIGELGVAAGQWARDQAPDDGWRLEAEALLAAEPLFGIPRARVAALRDSVADRNPYPALEPPLTHPVLPLRAEMQIYLHGLLSARLGDTAATSRDAALLDAIRDARAVPAHDLARGLRAELGRTRGDLKQALTELEGFQFDVSVPGVRAVAHWGIRERFLRAELLVALGRDEEALPWYDSFQGAYDLPFIAAAHFREGEIEERLGDRERADFHYARFLSMWRACDPEFQPLLAQARAGLSASAPAMP